MCCHPVSSENVTNLVPNHLNIIINMSSAAGILDDRTFVNGFFLGCLDKEPKSVPVETARPYRLATTPDVLETFSLVKNHASYNQRPTDYQRVY